jgi:hypothetical protein
MRQCDDADRDAPRVGCDCRECYLARRQSLDPDLLALINEQSFKVTASPARHIIHHLTAQYLTGKLEWAVLYLSIIRALTAELDRVCDDRIAGSMRTLANRLSAPGTDPFCLGAATPVAGQKKE